MTNTTVDGHIADIRDRDRIFQLLREFKPDLVFHAAALKHVPKDKIVPSTNCGMALTDKPAFSVQHHPEASPGPRDSHYLFDRFVAMMKDKQPKAA